MRLVSCVALVAAIAAVHASTAAADPTAATVLDVRLVKPHDVGASAPDSRAAAATHARELARCARSVTIDHRRPSDGALASVVVRVAAPGATGTVLADQNSGDAAPCLARLVRRWTFPDQGDLKVQVAFMPPVRRGKRVPAGYVAALTAVCAVDPVGAPGDTAARVQAALAAHPDGDVEALLRLLGFRFPVERAPLLRAAAAHAGLASCALADAPP